MRYNSNCYVVSQFMPLKTPMDTNKYRGEQVGTLY